MTVLLRRETDADCVAFYRWWVRHTPAAKAKISAAAREQWLKRHDTERASISLRRATRRDVKFFYCLRLEANEMSPSFSTALEEHRRWFNERVDKSLWYVALLGRARRVRIGYVRLDASYGTLMVSIVIGACWRGMGYGTRVLRTVEYPERVQIHAKVHSENLPSLRAFEKAGFKLDHADGMWHIYTKPNP